MFNVYIHIIFNIFIIYIFNVYIYTFMRKKPITFHPLKLIFPQNK